MNKVKKAQCRACLFEVNKKAISLFEEFNNLPIFSLINSITNVNIKENDGLPDRICSECFAELETAVSFKQKCEKSNNFLQASTLDERPENIKEVPITELGNLHVVKGEPEEAGTYIFGDCDILDAPQLFDDVGDFDTVGDASDDDHKPLQSVKEEKAKENGTKEFKSKAIDLHLQCDDCKGFFKSKCKLRVHWKKEHLTQHLICKSCMRDFKSYKAYHRHQKTRSISCKAASNFLIEGVGKFRTIYCKECSYKSKRIKDMISHWVIHTGERPYTCDKCGQSHTQLSALMTHRESVHKEYRIEMPCHVCGKLISGRYSIYRHLLTHSNRQVQCQICAKMLKNKKTLSDHMLRHDGAKNIQCEICAKTFYLKAELITHKNKKHSKVKQMHECGICSYKSHVKQTIVKHRAKHQAGNVCCTICGLFFDSDSRLTYHRRRHFEEKKHACPHCDQKYQRKHTLTKHIKKLHPMSTKVKDEEDEVATNIQDVSV